MYRCRTNRKVPRSSTCMEVVRLVINFVECLAFEACNLFRQISHGHRSSFVRSYQKNLNKTTLRLRPRNNHHRMTVYPLIYGASRVASHHLTFPQVLIRNLVFGSLLCYFPLGRQPEYSPLYKVPVLEWSYNGLVCGTCYCVMYPFHFSQGFKLVAVVR